MSHRNHLTPTVITDRNGKTTTVHKKQPVAHVAPPVIPAPAAAAGVLPEHVKARLAKELVTLLDSHSLLGIGKSAKLQRRLERFKEASTFELLKEVAEWNNSLPHPEGNFMYLTIMEHKESVVRETAFFRLRFNKKQRSHAATYLVSGLHFLDRYAETKHLEQLTGTELEIASAFLNVTAVLSRHASRYNAEVNTYDTHGVYIKSPELQELIAEHYDKSEDIITYIQERQSAEPDDLRNYLEHTGALRDGVL